VAVAQGYSGKVIAVEKEEIEDGTRILLERKWAPDKVLNQALVEGMRIVGVSPTLKYALRALRRGDNSRVAAEGSRD
jgi:methanogenic corrinoid protein MtbC1